MAYAQGAQYKVITSSSTTLATAVSAQKAALNAFCALSATNTVLNTAMFYAGATLGYVFISICSEFTTAPADVFTTAGAATWNIASTSATVVATWATNIATALNGFTTNNNQMPLLTNYNFIWDGTNLVSEIITNYVTVSA